VGGSLGCAGAASARRPAGNVAAATTADAAKNWRRVGVFIYSSPKQGDVDISRLRNIRRIAPFARDFDSRVWKKILIFFPMWFFHEVLVL
jgi:hypothetical protein